jgi:hypothetical protein
MKPNEAKKIIKAELEKRSLPFTKLTSKTIDFTDLAREARVFIKIWGWQPNPAMKEIKEFATSKGFCVETDGAFG